MIPTAPRASVRAEWPQNQHSFRGFLGRSEIRVNGVFLREHVSGLLPLVVEVTDHLRFHDSNIIAVRVDNSDDSSFPPGKPQAELDYSYFGGIYRDAWLVATDPVYITDANEMAVCDDGGVVFQTLSLNESEAATTVHVNVGNDTGAETNTTVDVRLLDMTGTPVDHAVAQCLVSAKSAGSVDLELSVSNPQPWSPKSPSTYALEIRIFGGCGEVADGYNLRVGLRTIEVSPEYGLVLNGEPYGGKLIGVNRHQDFAELGFAVPNVLHWRDARKLRDTGIHAIRNAHYPQDPAFMDACDVFGLFVIVTAPGWQFWNESPHSNGMY